MMADPGPVPEPLKSLPFLIFPSCHMVGEAKMAELLVDSLPEKDRTLLQSGRVQSLISGLGSLGTGTCEVLFFMTAAGVYSVYVTVTPEGWEYKDIELSLFYGTAVTFV